MSANVFLEESISSGSTDQMKWISLKLVFPNVQMEKLNKSTASFEFSIFVEKGFSLDINFVSHQPQ